ncbi:LuxR C-terminal-related transcriptional regulator [Homoserinibacter gongjuensis]|uniref:helix-turn-helix transcriptional regulator n=1 Tax=Homoserinibacter gongjuensis TaxID=1162968 RepID=UPI003D676556
MGGAPACGAHSERGTRDAARRPHGVARPRGRGSARARCARGARGRQVADLARGGRGTRALQRHAAGRSGDGRAVRTVHARARSGRCAARSHRVAGTLRRRDECPRPAADGGGCEGAAPRGAIVARLGPARRLRGQGPRVPGPRPRFACGASPRPSRSGTPAACRRPRPAGPAAHRDGSPGARPAPAGGVGAGPAPHFLLRRVAGSRPARHGVPQDALRELEACEKVADHSRRTSWRVRIVRIVALARSGMPSVARMAFDTLVVDVPARWWGGVINWARFPELREHAERVGVPGPQGAEADDVLREPLTQREAELLTLLRSDASVQQLAAEQFVSLNTIKTHLRNLYRKLAAASRSDAVDRAMRAGLFEAFRYLER